MSSTSETQASLSATRLPSYHDVLLLDKKDSNRLPSYRMLYLMRNHPYTRWGGHLRFHCIRSPPSFYEVIPSPAVLRARHLAAEAFFKKATQLQATAPAPNPHVANDVQDVRAALQALPADKVADTLIDILRNLEV